MELALWAVTYNGMSSGPFLSAIGKFLLGSLPENIGSTVSQIDIYAHFQSTAPALQSLESMHFRFEERVSTLPLCWLKRKSGLFEVAFHSKACTSEGIDACLTSNTGVVVFNNLCLEASESIKLLSKRIKPKDNFNFSALLSHLEHRLLQRPSSEAELEKLINRPVQLA